MVRIKSFLSKLAAVLVGLSVATATVVPTHVAAQGHDGRDPAYAEFYDALDPHGEWVEHPRYGSTWVPFANEDREWRPYSRGQWTYTEEHGWYWQSEEEFGWVTYHYGRWVMDERHGWMWVPGREWAPAWVAWRQGDETIGWAPLPPEAVFEPDAEGASTFSAYDSPRFSPMWIFVAPAVMLLPSIWRHAYPHSRNASFFGQTRFVTHYGVRDRQIYNRGIDRRFLEARTQRPVPVLQVRPMAGPRDLSPRGGGGGGQHVGIYRPQIAPAPGGNPGMRPGGFGGGPGARPGFDQGREPSRQMPARGSEPPGFPGGGRANSPSFPDQAPSAGPRSPLPRQDRSYGQPPSGPLPSGSPREYQRGPAMAPPSGPPPSFGGRPPIPPAAAPAPPPQVRPQVQSPPPSIRPPGPTPPPAAARPSPVPHAQRQGHAPNVPGAAPPPDAPRQPR